MEGSADSVFAQVLLNLGRQGGLEELRGLLQQVPVEEFAPEASKFFLFLFLERARQSGNTQGFAVVMGRWEVANQEPSEAVPPSQETREENVSVQDFGLYDAHRPRTRTSLFMDPQFSGEILKIVVQIYTWSLWDYMTDLMKHDSIPEVAFAAGRLLPFFPREANSAHFWERLAGQLDTLDDTSESGNEQLRKFISEQLRATAEFAPMPSWVKDYKLDLSQDQRDGLQREREDLPLDCQLVPVDVGPVDFELPTTEVAVGLLMQPYRRSQVGVNSEQGTGTAYASFIEAETERLRNEYLAADDAKRAGMIRAAIEKTSFWAASWDPTLFRILGPAHPVVNTKYEPDNPCPCAHYGGCRMFTCAEFENYDEFGIIDEDFNGVINSLVDWYGGSCDSCFKRIRYRHWAVRKPLASGGWMGCFCSWACVLESLTKPEDVVVSRLVESFKEQINEIGIQDRNYSLGYA